MTTRRKFVQLSLSGIPALSLPSAWVQRHIPLGLELFTVRRELAKSVPSTFKQIRAIGYEEIELIPDLYSYPAKDLRKMIEDHGLRVPSAFFDYDKFSASFDYAKGLGVDWMLYRILPDSARTPDGFRRAAADLNALGKRAQEMGMRVAFHTHDYEFRKMNGVTGFEILRAETDPELVFFEVDCYWITQAGLDPAELIHQLGKRVRMLHIKDRKPGFPFSNDMGESSQHFTEVGSGSIQWRQILALAQKVGVEHYIVEQDEAEMPMMQSVRISYNYLHKILP